MRGWVGLAISPSGPGAHLASSSISASPSVLVVESPVWEMLLRRCPGSGACGGSLAAGLLLLLHLSWAVRASEITFELPDNAKQCFYEEIVQGTKCTLEFQVRGCGGATEASGAPSHPQNNP